MESRFEVELNHPFNYAHQGQQITAAKVVLSAPSRRVLEQSAPIKQYIARAVKRLTEEQAGKEAPAKGAGGDEGLKGDEVLAVLMMYGEDHLKLELWFRELLVRGGLCLVDGVQPLTIPLYGELSDEDGDAILGEYLARFLVSSSMRK